MEQFSEEHSKPLFSKEWLVKIDNQKSTPYLFKFYSSTVDLSCWIMLTDTKSAWAEVMSSKQFARRWRDCNPLATSSNIDIEEDAWRTTNLELLSKAHTIGGITDLSFEVVESSYADIAFELECDAFKWRWETCFLGYKASAEIISKHLIFPLISVNHLAFTSTDAVSELPDTDIEKVVDKVGRTARRALDTHIRNAMSKPRVSTTLRRMTAMLNLVPELPSIISTAEKPDLHPEIQSSNEQTRVKTPVHRPNSPSSIKPPQDSPQGSTLAPHKYNKSLKASTVDSATESDTEEPVNSETNGKDRATSVQTTTHPLSDEITNTSTSQKVSSMSSTSHQPSLSKGPLSDSDSSPVRPAKKAKKPRVSSSDDDSEEERKRRVAQLKSGAGTGGVKRGTRQPIKRGGKRF